MKVFKDGKIVADTDECPPKACSSCLKCECSAAWNRHMSDLAAAERAAMRRDWVSGRFDA